LLSASSAFNVQGTGLRTGCPVFELQKVREAERGRGRQSARKRRPMEVRWRWTETPAQGRYGGVSVAVAFPFIRDHFPWK